MNNFFSLGILLSVIIIFSSNANILLEKPSTLSLEKYSEIFDDFKKIETVNNDFYNDSGDSFDKIPFETLLPDLFLKYLLGHTILEIGSGAGALAEWFVERGYQVTCLEPAQQLAMRAEVKGLSVIQTTIQNFSTDQKFDNIVAISSLIHVPKTDLSNQIKKIAGLLNPTGLFVVSFIEGEDEGFEDPTNVGKVRYFAKWTKLELEQLSSPYFTPLENHRIYNKKMDRTFLLMVYRKK